MIIKRPRRSQRSPTQPQSHDDVRFYLTEADIAHSEIHDLLSRTLNPGEYDFDLDADYDRFRFIREVYDDYVIYRQGEDLYRRDYSISDDKAVTLGDAQKVTAVTTFEPVVEAVADEPQTAATETVESPVDEQITLTEGVLLEAADTDGWNWRVQVIRSGVSANGNEYPLAVLREAAPIYDGVPAYYGRGRDHNPDERGFGSIAGWVINPKPNPYGIEATLEINRGKPEIREAIQHAWDVKCRTGRETIGFSHVIPRGGAIVEARKPRGYRVKKLTRAQSVDIVMAAAAGGGLIAPLSESGDVVLDPLQEAIMDIDTLLAKLRNGERLGTDELSALQAAIRPEELAEAVEARRVKLAESDEEHTEDAEAGSASTTTLDVTADTGHVETFLSESQDRIDRLVKDLEDRARLAECQATLTTTLAESHLPSTMLDAIKLDFGDRIFEAAELEERIKRDKGIAAELLENRPHGLGRITLTEDQVDKHRKAMDGMFGLIEREDGTFETRSWHRTPIHFRSIKEAFEAVTGRRVDDARVILAEAINFLPQDLDPLLAESIDSSTFGQILGDSVRRRMIAEYQMPGLQNFQQLVSEVSNLQDFRTNHRVRLGGYGDLPVIAEGGTYNSLPSPGDEEVTYAPEKRGGLEDLTMEMILNDDMQVVRQIPIRLGRSAAGTLNRYVFLTILANNATIYDNLPLFHNNHGNLDNEALSATAMTKVRAAMRAQKPYGHSLEYLGAGNLPRRLFVPGDLEEIAFKISTSAPYVIASTEDATTPNIHRGIQVTVVDEWTDTDDWIAAADPNNTPLLEIGYLNGREEPELFVQDAQTVGSVFTADKITYKIRHIWGVAVLDYRGLYKNTPST